MSWPCHCFLAWSISRCHSEMPEQSIVKNHIIFSRSVFSESVYLTVHRIILVGNYPICRNHHYIDIGRTYHLFQRQINPLHAQSLHLLFKRHRWTVKNVVDNDKMEKVCFKSSNNLNQIQSINPALCENRMQSGVPTQHYKYMNGTFTIYHKWVVQCPEHTEN